LSPIGEVEVEGDGLRDGLTDDDTVGDDVVLPFPAVVGEEDGDLVRTVGAIDVEDVGAFLLEFVSHGRHCE